MRGGQHPVDVAETPVAGESPGSHYFPRPRYGPARLHRLDDEVTERDDRAERKQ